MSQPLQTVYLISQNPQKDKILGGLGSQGGKGMTEKDLEDTVVSYKGHIVSVEEDGFLLQTFAQKILHFPNHVNDPSLLSLYQLGQYVEVDISEDNTLGVNIVVSIRIASQQLASQIPHAQTQSATPSPTQTFLSVEETLLRVKNHGDLKWLQLAQEGNYSEAVVSLRHAHNLPPSMALSVVKLFRKQQEQSSRLPQASSDVSAKLTQAMPTFTSWLTKKKDKDASN